MKVGVILHALKILVVLLNSIGILLILYLILTLIVMLEIRYLNKYNTFRCPGEPVSFRFVEITAMKLIENIKSNAMGSNGLDFRMVLLIVPHLLRHVTLLVSAYCIIVFLAACS